MKIKFNSSSIRKMIALFAVVAFAILIFPSGSILAKAQQGFSNSEKKAIVQEKKEDKKEENKQNVQDKMCDKISAADERITGNLADLENKLQARKEARLERFEKKVADAQRRREEWRKRVDANIEAQLKKMMGLAKTEAQKDAIIEYEKTLKNAIATRRLAIDQAQETFRIHLRELFSLRKDNLNGLLLGYRQARKAAFDKAQNQCAAGADMNQVRTDLKADLKQARETFQEQIRNREKTNANLKAYVDERNQAIRKAQDDFKLTMTQARADLKKALGETEIEEPEDTDKDGTEDAEETGGTATNEVTVQQKLKQ
jgi:hypothetical protein